jgi:hypothetical protein
MTMTFLRWLRRTAGDLSAGAAVLVGVALALLGASGAMEAVAAGRPPMLIGACLALMFWSGCVAGSLLTEHKRR